MKYFTIKELCNSDTAIKLNIDNTPNSIVVNNLQQLVQYILDPLREEFGKAIYVTSGYRCLKLNKAVGGSITSQHCKGLAADITAKSKLDNVKLFKLIQNLQLPFDQLIDENNYSWIHVSYSDNPRKQILHL